MTEVMTKTTWKNQFGETLRLEWEDDKPVLYHSDFDDVPVDLDIRVVGYDRKEHFPDLLPGQVTQETMMRKAAGDIVLNEEEQRWLLGEMLKHGMRAKRS